MEKLNVRDQVIGMLELLSSPSEQLKYEEGLINAAGHAPAELFSMYCDDLYHPKFPEFIAAFSENELKELAHLYGLMAEMAHSIPSTVTELIKMKEWRRIVQLASQIRYESLK